MKDIKITFIGGGNMGQAMIGGMLKHHFTPAQICVLDPVIDEKLTLLGINTTCHPGEAFINSQVIIWAIKPQIFKSVAQELQPHILPDSLHISVAAGITTDSIGAWVKNRRVVRAMPNTPALIGMGQIGLYTEPALKQQYGRLVDSLFSGIGTCFWVNDENQLHAITALSGSGPAYIYYVLEAMLEAASELGIDPDQALPLLEGTFQGAVALLQHKQEHPYNLRQQVTSKGGTTEAAISAMHTLAVNKSIRLAIHEAYKRSLEIAREFG
ncbi:MAG: pyrroline-5-carboxylate reductase [Gammaproteobacteria bacterium]|nr:pyrroline-5-carboxylate reductase [Gammaproteobacteria bacterium]